MIAVPGLSVPSEIVALEGPTIYLSASLDCSFWTHSGFPERIQCSAGHFEGKHISWPCLRKMNPILIKDKFAFLEHPVLPDSHLIVSGSAPVSRVPASACLFPLPELK